MANGVTRCLPGSVPQSSPFPADPDGFRRASIDRQPTFTGRWDGHADLSRTEQESSMKIRQITARTGVSLLTLAGPLGLMALPAGADPVNAKKGEILEIDCEENGTLLIASNGSGRWTPGLVTINNRVGIPYEFHNQGTFTPVGGTPETFTEDIAKPAPRNGRLDSCTFHIEGSDENGTFELDGFAKISYTPMKA
jgi:hypothetical protein